MIGKIKEKFSSKQFITFSLSLTASILIFIYSTFNYYDSPYKHTSTYEGFIALSGLFGLISFCTFFDFYNLFQEKDSNSVTFQNSVDQSKICKSCGTVQYHPNVEKRGSIFITIILLFFYLVPGIIYAIWRHSTKHEECISCKGSDLIPSESPLGKKIQGDLGIG